MRRRSVRLFPLSLLVVATTALPSCSQTFDATMVGVPVTMAAPADRAPSGTAFSITKRSAYLFWGIFPVSRPSAEDILAGQLIDGSGISDLRIKVRSRFVDVLVSVLTLGVVVPRSVTFEGVVLPPAP